MQALLRKLSSILGREHEQYRKLVELLSGQREAIVSHHPETLNELVKYQETIVLELKALDEARVALMRKIARSLGVSSADPTLSQIAEHLDDPFAAEYRTFAQDLRLVVQEIESLSQDNHYLLDRSLDHVNRLLRFFTSAQMTQGGNYTEAFQQPAIRQGKLLCKTA